MIKIYAMADTEFQKIDKLVVANFSSMDSENYFSNRAGNCVIKRKIWIVFFFEFLIRLTDLDYADAMEILKKLSNGNLLVEKL